MPNPNSALGMSYKLSLTDLNRYSCGPEPTLTKLTKSLRVEAANPFPRVSMSLPHRYRHHHPYELATSTEDRPFYMMPSLGGAGRSHQQAAIQSSEVEDFGNAYSRGLDFSTAFYHPGMRHEKRRKRMLRPRYYARTRPALETGQFRSIPMHGHRQLPSQQNFPAMPTSPAIHAKHMMPLPPSGMPPLPDNSSWEFHCFPSMAGLNTSRGEHFSQLPEQSLPTGHVKPYQNGAQSTPRSTYPHGSNIPFWNDNLKIYPVRTPKRSPAAYR